MAAALDQKSSLILFPEGTRNTSEEPLLPFKSGLYHLAKARPDVELVPVWIDNLNRVMPKGEFVPIPLLCTVTLGAPIVLGTDEDEDGLLGSQPQRAARARHPQREMTDDRRTADPRLVHRRRAVLIVASVVGTCSTAAFARQGRIRPSTISTAESRRGG